jgi:hypothetical protein
MRDVSENGVLQNEATISFGFNDKLGFVTPGHAATEGGLCFFMPTRTKRLSWPNWVRSKRHEAPEDRDPLPTSDTAIAVPDMVARLFGVAYSGKLRPRVARRDLATLLKSGAARD